MSKRAPNGSVPAFADFLAYLRAQGFSIGLDHYVRLQKLLERIGNELHPNEEEWFALTESERERKREQLKTLLCPLFATSPKQQEKFYAAYADYADLLQVASAPRKEKIESEEGASQPHSKKGPSRRWFYLSGAALAVVLVLLGVRFALNPTPIPTPSPTPTPESVIVVPPEVTQVPIPIISPAVATVAETGQTRPWRFYFLVGFALLVIFLLWELIHVLARKLIVRREAAQKPPTTWPIRVAASAPALYDSEEFYKAARLMRRRQVAEYHRLDVNATIAATVAASGFPSFRYKPDSKAPEYLVLIDRTSFRDHQAQLFNELVKAFEREGLFVVRYFYESDPRVCCDEKGENCIHLSELQNQYGQHRLLIFGDAARMIDPISGTMASWASVFHEWQERAILTPETDWGLREFSLSTQFVVLPASLDGLLALVDHFEALITIDPRLWSKVPPTPVVELEPSDAVVELRERLGEQTFQWLCACAVYPEVQWNLTLYLGSLPCMGESTITEKNLLKLVRLPWFHTGTMPDDLRWPLINHLGEREREVRAAIVSLLEKDPPSAGTFATEKYDLELALQRWRYHQDAASLDELRQSIRRLPPGQILQNQTLVRYLERVPNPVIDIVLPRRLRKYFFRNGLPWFGLRTSARLLITLLAIGLAVIAIRASLIPVPSFLQQPVTSPTPTPEVDAYPSASPDVSPATGESPTLSPSLSPEAGASPAALPILSPGPPGSPTPDEGIKYGGGAKSLDTLQPVVANLARTLIATARKQGIEVMVIGTYISNDEQDKLYARGRTLPGQIVTNAKGGQSSHNQKIAFDIVPIVNGKPAFNDVATFNKLGAIGRSLGLTWGGDFPNFKDYPHFQYGSTVTRLPVASPTPALASPTPVDVSGMGDEVTIIDNTNIAGVQNRPRRGPSFFTRSSLLITYIFTYHWNAGQGALPGTVSLRSSNGTVYGPWKVTASSGQGGAPNTNWVCRPNVVVPPGSYTLIDSDPATWSQNGETNGEGFSRVMGRRVSN